MLRTCAVLTVVLRVGLFSVLAVLAALASACGFDGIGSGSTSASPSEPAPGSAGPPASFDPNGDGGAMGAAVCTDRVLSFDGVDDTAGVSTADALELPGDFTIEAWVKPASVDAEMEVVSHGSAAASNGWILRIKGGHIEASVYGRGHFLLGLINVPENTTTGGAGAAYLVPGAWAFVAATMSSGVLRVYHDGALKGTSGPPGAFGRDNFGGSVVFGNASAPATSHPYGGELDDVRLSKVARYTGDTSAVPGAALEVDADTIALWHFDEPSNVFLDDATGAHGGFMPKDTTAPSRTTAPCPASR